MAAFKVPTLRNIDRTAPYMHDGRFATLEEVVDFYNTGVKRSTSVDPLLQYNLQPGGLGLSAQDKSDLLAFLKTLTDERVLSDSRYAKP
jgi:cytochrome c peroxidase